MAVTSIPLQRVKSNLPNQINRPVYYVRAKSLSVVGREKLIENVVNETHLPQPYVEAVLGSAFKGALDYLQLGHAVQMPGLGTLKLNVLSRAQEEPEKATANTVSGVRLQLIPLKEVKQSMRDFRYDLVDTTPRADDGDDDVVAPGTGGAPGGSLED